MVEKLNIASGKMYPWCDYTTNPLAGKCPHNCFYCYMKRPPVCWSKKYAGILRLDFHELKERLTNREIHRRINLPFVPDDVPIIFVCSGNDLGIAGKEIKETILAWLWKEPRNVYLLQSKNPEGFMEVREKLPPRIILGTTVETNRVEICRQFSKAPPPSERLQSLSKFEEARLMVSVEPKMKCDPKILAEMILAIHPAFVSIGADSGKNNLPEPTREQLVELLNLLEEHTLVLRKNNLGRLLEASV